MATSLDNKLVVAISSRALFNFEEENRIFKSGDPQAYMNLQLERLDQPAPPGIAFSLIKKLLAFNDAAAQRVEVVILSRNDPVSGMRIFRSGEANQIKLERGVFTQGRSPFRYLRPLRAHLVRARPKVTRLRLTTPGGHREVLRVRHAHGRLVVTQR